MKVILNKGLSLFMAALVLGMAALSVLMQTEAASPYMLSVNVTANVVTVYYNDEPIRAMTCSTGEDTPKKGTKYLREKYRWKSLYHNSYGQYCTRYDDHMLLHSVPYMRANDNSALAMGLFDLLGQSDSMGCIRLLCGDAKWLYENVPSGTKVTFYCDEENPGELGWPYHPARRNISMVSGYDPTDPDETTLWEQYMQSAFDADYYLANNPDLLGIDAHWTDVTLRLHWLMEGMNEGRQASPYFNVNTYKAAHPELVPYYGDTNFKYISQYNYDVARGVNVPKALANEDEVIPTSTQAADGSIVTVTAMADGNTSRVVKAPDGSASATITKQLEDGRVVTVEAELKVPEQQQTTGTTQQTTGTTQQTTGTTQQATGTTQQVTGTTQQATGTTQQTTGTTQQVTGTTQQTTNTDNSQQIVVFE